MQLSKITGILFLLLTTELLYSSEIIQEKDKTVAAKTDTLKPAVQKAETEWRSKLYPENWKPGFNDGNGRFLHDFSYAGYHQGEKKIPFIENNIVDVTLPPYNADNTGTTDATSAIQTALNSVGLSGGGVVYLPAGKYRVNPGFNESALRIRYDNTILRGAGPDSTFIYNSANKMREKSIIWMMGNWCTWTTPSGTTAKLRTDLLLPTRIIPLKSVSGFKKGDDIILRTDGTPGFIEEHLMSGVWSSTTIQVMFLRKIDSINVENNLIYIDSPTRYFMKTRDNARIYHAKKHIKECGIENLSIGNRQSDKPGWGENDYSVGGTGAYDVHASHAIYIKYAQNCWVTHVKSYKPEENSDDFHLLSNSLLMNQSRGITVDSCFFQKPQYEGGGGNGYMYTLAGNDCLVKNSRANDSRHNFDFKFAFSNGNVIHNCLGENSKYSSDFHMYLSMSNLFDVFTVDKDYLESVFRPYGGSAIHGYSSTQSVFYNTTGKAYHSNKDYIVESRQFRHGYIIGTSGAANRVKLTPVVGSTGGYDYNTSPQDFSEGIGKGAGLMPQSLYLDQLQRRLQDSTGLPNYNVKIIVKHKFTNEPLASCTINSLNEKAVTNVSGTAELKNANSLLILNFEKEKFYPLTNRQLAVYSDTTLTFYLTPLEYSVTIVVHDEATGEVFAGVPVVFNGATEVTNSVGAAYFSAYNGTFSYHIQKNSYIDETGTLTVTSDSTYHFYLVRSSAFIKFRLKYGTTPINKATVVLNGDTLLTTSLGIANFRDLPVQEEYKYFIRKEGYSDVSDTLFLTADTTINVAMTYPTFTFFAKESNDLKIWPNPVTHEMLFEIPENWNNAVAQILDLKGNVLKTVALKNRGRHRIVLNDLTNGTYLLRIYSANRQANKLFLKSN